MMTNSGAGLWRLSPARSSTSATGWTSKETDWLCARKEMFAAMSNLKKALYFTILIESDGTNKNAVVDFAADPVAFSLAASGTVIALLLSTLPTDIPIDSLSSSLGIASATYNSLTHQLSVTFTNAGTDDSLYALNGIALY